MTEPGEEIITGFNRPRPVTDGYVASQYRGLGLGEEPSLADIEPHAVAMMREGKVFEAMGLALGREVFADDVKDDPELAGIALLSYQQPEQGFGCLLLKLTADEARAEQQEG